MKNHKDWFKRRNYLHITPKIHTKPEVALTKAKASNPDFVAKYAFFPLIHRIDKERKYKKLVDNNGDFVYNKQGKLKRSHCNPMTKQTQAKLRPIEYATHLDTQIYTYYAKKILCPIYEAILKQNPTLNESIIAYRQIPHKNNLRNKNNIDFAKDVFNHIRNKGECAVLTFDIKDFFPSINHQLLKRYWANLLNCENCQLPKDHYNIYKSVTKYSYIHLQDLRKGKGFDEKKLAELRKKGIEAFFESPKEFREQVKSGTLRIYKNKDKGIPHGLPISAFLANLYMLDFDKAVVEKLSKTNGFYRRYSDDIVIVCLESEVTEVEKIVKESIGKLNVRIAENKTEVFFFRKDRQGTLNIFQQDKLTKSLKPNIPLIYLGFEFYGNKVLLKSAKLAKFYRRMKKAIKTTIRHASKKAQKELNDNITIHKRSLKRRFTEYGSKPRNEKKKINYLVFNEMKGIFEYQLSGKESIKKYRGNFLTYAKKAAEVFQSNEIYKQLRNHQRIFYEYLAKRRRKM